MLNHSLTGSLLICFLAIGVSAGLTYADSAPRFWGKLEPGPHRVGLRVMTLYDEGRSDAAQKQAAQGRPVEITVWYPAAPSNASSFLSLADYLKLTSDATNKSQGAAIDGAPARRRLSAFISSDEQALPDHLLDQILSTRMMASKDARQARGKFPLVLWSARHATPLAQSVLCEYLASHGYVVAFARYKGAAMPLPYEAKTSEEKLAALDAHVGDLQFALACLSKASNVDWSKVAVIAWSYAGESAALLQMQNPEVDLVISLSSNVLTGWVYQNIDALARLDQSKLNVPYIIMTERVATGGAIRTAPAIMDEMPAKSHFVTFTELAHGNFNAVEGMIPALMKIDKVPRWSKAGPVAQLGYETMSRFTLRFLNSYLKSNERRPDPLRKWRWEDGLPKGFVSIEAHGKRQIKPGSSN